MNQHVWQCSSPAAQLDWTERALRNGNTLTDSHLWLGGVDHPQQAIARLRKKGLAIDELTVKVVDAADEEHDDLAWKLAPAPT